jgi:hypothetical protein
MWNGKPVKEKKVCLQHLLAGKMLLGFSIKNVDDSCPMYIKS